MTARHSARISAPSQMAKTMLVLPASIASSIRHFRPYPRADRERGRCRAAAEGAIESRHQASPPLLRRTSPAPLLLRRGGKPSQKYTSPAAHVLLRSKENIGRRNGAQQAGGFAQQERTMFIDSFKHTENFHVGQPRPNLLSQSVSTGEPRLANRSKSAQPPAVIPFGPRGCETGQSIPRRRRVSMDGRQRRRAKFRIVRMPDEIDAEAN